MVTKASLFSYHTFFLLCCFNRCITLSASHPRLKHQISESEGPLDGLEIVPVPALFRAFNLFGGDAGLFQRDLSVVRGLSYADFYVGEMAIGPGLEPPLLFELRKRLHVDVFALKEKNTNSRTFFLDK